MKDFIMEFLDKANEKQLKVIYHFIKGFLGQS